MAYLVQRLPDGTELRLPIGERSVLLGRGQPCEIRVDDQTLSRKQARIERRGLRWWVIDLVGDGRLLLNGRPVLGAELRDGDEIRCATLNVYVIDPENLNPDSLRPYVTPPPMGFYGQPAAEPSPPVMSRATPSVTIPPGPDASPPRRG
jgi:pSer/pThr/pTyr-binding forkhead associated (FHA) protein